MGKENIENEELERWKLFYNVSSDVYDREENRYERLEDKALHCLTAFSLLLAIYGFLWRHLLDNIFPPQCFIEGVLSVFSAILILLFILSWIITFRTFQVEKRKVMPLHGGMLKYFKDKSRNLTELYHGLGEINKEAYDDNRKVTEKEIERFKLGFRMIRYSVIALIVFIIMYITYLWC